MTDNESHERILSEDQAAEFLGVKRSLLMKLRKEETRSKIPYFCIGRNVRYYKRTLLEWAQMQTKSKRKPKMQETEIVRVM